MENSFYRMGPIRFLALACALIASEGFAATVFGTVAEAPEHPVPQAWVYLERLPAKESDSMRTDSAGAYRFTDVTGCEGGCAIEVRAAGYRPFSSGTFSLEADGTRWMDVPMDRIHNLSIRVVKAEDTAEAVPASQAMMTSYENADRRWSTPDSAGMVRFLDLQPLTGYLLSVSAPGRKAYSSTIHFHYPFSDNVLRVPLDSDVAGTGKTLSGTLSVRGAGPAAGENLFLGCRTVQVAADLFARTEADGKYAIAGVPAACDSVTLYAGADTTAIALPDGENRFDWSVTLPDPSPIRPGRALRAGRAARRVPGRGYDAAGRKGPKAGANTPQVIFVRGPNRP